MAVDVFIEGIPYAQSKVRGDVGAPGRWSEAVKKATERFPKAQGPCYLFVQYVLPEDKYPLDHPYGPDLDNLLKRLLDALNQTVFSEVAGKDGAVVHLVAAKRKASDGEPIGARVIVSEVG